MLNQIQLLTKRLLLVSMLAIGWPVMATNKSIEITTQNNIQTLLDQTPANAILNIAEGRYVGNIKILKPVTINCAPNTYLSGNHQQDTIRIIANDVTINGCNIIEWGNNLTDMNAGIFAEKTANNLIIKNNSLKGDTFGMWLDSPASSQVINNKVEGNLSIRSQDRGNGIHLFNVTDALVEGNEVWHTRDGIYIDTSNHNQLKNNVLHDLRYGIHYMYSYSNHIEGNHTYNTRTGYALMQSKYLTVVNNTSENDKNYGILMNYIVESEIRGNTIKSIKQPLGVDGTRENYGAEGKGLFIYNAPFNRLSENLIENSDIGIHLTAGSEGNKIFRNYFVSNRQQVKYVGNRKVEWSFEKQGNFWSDYLGWDRNADNIGDEVFEPNDGIDKILWKYPAANVLFNSPAIQTLRWVQKEFPVLKSPGITDSYPLMKNDFQTHGSGKN